MKHAGSLLLTVLALLLLGSCAPRNVGVLKAHDTSRKIKTVYVWDADGHTDLSLLLGLKTEARSYLALNGFMVSKDPNTTEAYVKITVDDAEKGEDGFIKARLYIIGAADQKIIYDKYCDVGSDSPGYPAARFVDCALKEFAAGPGAGD